MIGLRATPIGGIALHPVYATTLTIDRHVIVESIIDTKLITARDMMIRFSESTVNDRSTRRRLITDTAR